MESEKIKQNKKHLLKRSDVWLPEARVGGKGELNEGGQKVQTSAVREMYSGYVAYNIMTVLNNALQKVAKRVNPESSHQKEEAFFFFFVTM